jgi:hypothetical protein
MPTPENATLPLIFAACKPKEDVRAGTMADAEFAADLSMVLRGSAPPEYLKPSLFFANTYPTRGLKNLLANVCSRLSHGTGVASIFRLDTSYGGGKTHGLIALIHAVRSGNAVPGIEEFVAPEDIPSGEVQIAAFDGENADPTNGRLMESGLRAFTPWGELAYGLRGKAGYDLVKPSDIARVAPGADTLRELFGSVPTLILLDELSVYLRKVGNIPNAKEQLTAFLTAIFKAVESSPNAVLVYTLAVGKDGKAADAYGAENQFIAQQMAELESVSARKATILNPTEDDETVQVLKRRLFQSVDDSAAEQVVAAYRALWMNNREALPTDAIGPEAMDTFRASYPLHPEVLATLTGKTATVANFQRVRDTVEAAVYKVLRERIKLFGYVVGKLQPILSQVAGQITRAVLSGKSDGAAETVVEDIQRGAAEAEKAAFDLDSLLAGEPPDEDRTPALYDLGDLGKLLKDHEQMLPDIQIALRSEKQAFYQAPGMETPIRVTVNAESYDDHLENVELWSPGNPLFPWQKREQ